MRLAIILTIIITTVLAAGIGWAASLSVDSDQITAYTINQAPEVPTPSPTPVPVPITLYLDGISPQGQLLYPQPDPMTARSVSVGGLLLPVTRYSISTPGSIDHVTTDTSWSLTLVAGSGLLNLSLLNNLSFTVYWQAGGPCGNPISGQIFAQGSNFNLASGIPVGAGHTFPLTTVAGSQHQFDPNDRLCLRITGSSLLSFTYQTGVPASNGLGVSQLNGPIYAP